MRLKKRIMAAAFTLLFLLLINTASTMKAYGTDARLGAISKKEASDNPLENAEDALDPVGTTVTMSRSEYENKMNAFISDSRWCNNTSWGNQGPKLSSHGSSQCYAYACDFTKYMYGIDNCQGGERFCNVDEIRTGDVIRENNHTFVVLKRDGNNLYTAEGNFGQPARVRVANPGYYISNGSLYTSWNEKCFLQNDTYFSCHFVNLVDTPSNRDPKGYLDGVSGGEGSITVYGWAIDDDDPNAQLRIHVYVGDYAREGHTAEFHEIIANKYRPDGGIGWHGFEETIYVERTGTQPVYVYALDTANGNNPCLTGSGGSVTITGGRQMDTGYDRALPDGYYYIISGINDDYALDVAGTDQFSEVPNVEVCSRSIQGNQDIFYLQYYETNKFYTIKHDLSGKYLDVQGASNASRANVVAHPYNGTIAQQWAIKRNGDYTYNIESKCSGYRLDAWRVASDSGISNVCVMLKNDGNAQKWVFVPYAHSIARSIEDGNYHIVSAYDENKGMNVANTNGNPKNVTAEANLTDPNQVFSVEYDSSRKAYRMKRKGTAFWLENEDSGRMPNAAVALGDEAGNPDGSWKYWALKPGDNDTYNMINMKNGQYPTYNPSDHNVEMSAPSFDNRQKWKFVRAVDGVSISRGNDNGESTITLTPVITPKTAGNKNVTWTSSDDSIASVNSNGVVTARNSGTATITVTTEDGSYSASCLAYVKNNKITVFSSPSTEDGVSTWDCIWFGDYWQEDTNGDGYCFEKETVVSKNGNGELVDQDGTRIYDSIPEGTYPADKKQPIKWRMLDIDAEGNAILLADKLIDIVQYNDTPSSVTWETCTLRSYLNGYGSTLNVCNKDFSGDKSFIYNAFSEAERDRIKTSTLTNPNNPIFGTPGGNSTQDKIFCLSIDEAVASGYGFVVNKFTKPSSDPKYYTDNDPTRGAVTTKFTDDKPGYYGGSAGKSDWWWLRSPGGHSDYASLVNSYGAAYASGRSVSDEDTCARPAFRMNLSSSSSLWSYAGTISSDGTMNEVEKSVTVPVTGLILTPEQATVKVGGSTSLTATVSPLNATEKTVIWRSSDDKIAKVDDSGNVTGVTSGVVFIYAETKDGGFKKSCKVTVESATAPDPLSVPVMGVSLPDQKSVKVRGSITLIPSFTPTNATNQKVTWRSSNDKIAMVDNGVVTGIDKGVVTITVRTDDGGHEDTCIVEVLEVTNNVPVSAVYLSSKKSVNKGHTITLTPVIVPENATIRTVTWKSSNEKIARIDADGVVTGVKVGEATITVRSDDGGFEDTCLIEVTDTSNPDNPSPEEPDSPVNPINLEENLKTEYTLIPGEVRRLSVNTTGQYGYGIKWDVQSAYPKGCVTVKNGVATAKKAGRATVTAVYGESSITFHVTVDGTVPERKIVYVGGKAGKLSATKTVKANVGEGNRKATVSIPANLRFSSGNLSYEVKEPGVCEVRGPYFNNSGSKASFEIVPREAGATYIVWSIKDDTGSEATACTKVLVKKSVTNLSIAQGSEITLKPGEGKRLTVFETKDNTEAKDLSFSVQGSGIKVSKSGYVVGTTPYSNGAVIVKSGKANATVRVSVSGSSGNYLVINKPSVTVTSPKSGVKTTYFKVVNPIYKADRPSVTWAIAGSPKGISVNGNGAVSVGANASPGCYVVKASAAGYNTVCCEVVVR